jgi:hypothetical protein
MISRRAALRVLADARPDKNYGAALQPLIGATALRSDRSMERRRNLQLALLPFDHSSFGLSQASSLGSY